MSEPTVDALWASFADTLRRWFRARVASAEDADDLLQETFLRLVNGLERLRDEHRVEPWLRTVARSVLIDHQRRVRPQAELEDTPSAVEEPGARDADVERTVASWLEPAIAALPPADAEVLALSELEELPLKTIAERSGASLSAVKSRVQRARARLRASLLACCRFEIDRRGGIVDWQRHGPDCAPCEDEAC